MKKNIKYLIMMCFLSLYCYFLFYEYISIYNLLYSICIMILLAIYKWILNQVFFKTIMTINRSEKNKINIVDFFNVLNDKLLIKNVWLIKPIYYILYYFPTNWPYLIVLWIGRKWWDIRLYINSNKDIIGKKYFKKDWSNYDIYNNKIIFFIKKYIVDVLFYNYVYIFMYIKINLLSYKWEDFFQLKLFGIIYSGILIATNLNWFIWLRKTEIILMWQKFTIVFIIIYILLYLFPIYIRKIDEKIDANLLYVYKGNRDVVDYYQYDVYKFLYIELNKLLDEKNMANYYFMREYLIGMCLAEKYFYYFDNLYNLVISKNFNKNNINLPKNRIKVGLTKIEFEYSFNLLTFYKEKYQIEINLKNHNSMIWVLEKNYRISFFVYSFFTNARIYHWSIDYAFINYELYKSFYSVEVIEKCFKEELEEEESFDINYFVWYEWLVNDLKLDNYFKGLLINEIIINKKIMINSEQYKRILSLFNFFFLYDRTMLYLNYELTFSPEMVHYIKLIISDIYYYESEYGTDYKKFLEFWEFKEEEDKEEEGYLLVKLKKEMFLNHIPNKDLRINKLKQKAQIYYNEISKLNMDEFLNKLEELQNEHKKKYFLKKPKYVYLFFKYNKMVEEWDKYMEKENLHIKE